MVKIGRTTPIEERVELVKLLKEYRDVLAFSYDELKVYREDVIQHVIPLKEETKPFRQKLRQINPKLAPLVQQELQKMLEAGIIAQTRHSSWCSNMVVARKKNGKIRICIDFRNLNRACTKDHYPLPKMETLLQRVTGSGMISMLDGFSGYNQIRLKKLRIGIRLHLLLHGELLNISGCHLVYQMLEPLFKGQWIMPLGG
jgi:hypothetical protein